MKSVKMTKTFNYRPHRMQSIQYKAGETYHKVPEAAVEAILASGTGAVIGEDEATPKRRTRSEDAVGG